MNETADVIDNNCNTYCIYHFSVQNARSCGYARMEELYCAVLLVLSSIDESKDAKLAIGNKKSITP